MPKKKPLSFEEQLEQLIKGTQSITFNRDGDGLTISASFGRGRNCLAFAGSLPKAVKVLKNKLVQAKSSHGDR